MLVKVLFPGPSERRLRPLKDVCLRAWPLPLFSEIHFLNEAPLLSVVTFFLSHNSDYLCWLEAVHFCLNWPLKTTFPSIVSMVDEDFHYSLLCECLIGSKSNAFDCKKLLSVALTHQWVGPVWHGRAGAAGCWTLDHMGGWRGERLPGRSPAGKAPVADRAALALMRDAVLKFHLRQTRQNVWDEFYWTHFYCLLIILLLSFSG